MAVGFIIWSTVFLLIVCIAVYTFRAKKAVPFFSGVMLPEIKNVKQYNRSLAALWFVYAVVYEALGVPILFLDHFPAGFVIPVIGMPVSTLALAAVYSALLKRHK